MDSETVVLCYPASTEDISEIQQSFPGSQIVVADQNDIGQKIHSATIFCGHAKKNQIDWQEVVANGKLRWIQSSAAGLDHCLADSVVRSGILVSGCSGLFANQVAEQTLALLYGLVRRMPQFYRQAEKKIYERSPTDTLHGKSVGIVGFGGNGRRIAELLKDVAGKILATDSFPEFEKPGFVEVYAADQLDLLLQMSDVVVVTLPLTSCTRNLLGAEQFATMRDGSYFINVARGAIVDHAALREAIKNQKIAFAGLDVIDPEPLPADSPFWEEERVVITPHVGAQSADRVSLTTRLFCENARRLFNGKRLFNLVDKELGFPRPEHRIRFDCNGKWQL